MSTLSEAEPATNAHVPTALRPAGHRRAAAVLRRRWLPILIASLVIAGLTYAASSISPPQYTSTASVVVNVSGSNPNDDVTAANSIAAQYAQDVTAQAVLAAATHRLDGTDAGGLSTAVSGGTVAAENIVQVTATGGNAGQAQRRAAAVIAGLDEYISNVNAQQTHAYNTAAQAQLAPINAQVAQVSRQIAHADPRQLSTGRYLALQTTLSTLIAQRSSAMATIAEQATGGQPSIAPLSPASAGAQTAPRPMLYAGVAFLIALIVIMQLAVYLSPEPA